MATSKLIQGDTIKPVTFIGLRHFSYNIVTTDNQDVHF